MAGDSMIANKIVKIKSLCNNVYYKMVLTKIPYKKYKYMCNIFFVTSISTIINLII